MQLLTLTALLIVHCCSRGSLVSGESARDGETGKITNIGTVNIDGSILRVYDVDGVHVAQPRLSFKNACNSLKYNHMYQKYQLTLPMRVDLHVIPPTASNSKTVGQATLSGLSLRANRALASKEAGLAIMVELMQRGVAQLIFLCNSFVRCERLRDEVASNPDELWRAVSFEAIAKVRGNCVRFSAIRTVNSPAFICTADRWITFQRRVDATLSFAQKWDAYVRGFGNPSSNYWMGLERLFAMTVTGAKNGYTESSRCRLRIETQDFDGQNHWGEYKLFEVLGPEQNYRLRIGLEVKGSQLYGILQHDGMQFSTQDKDNDLHAGSCSQLFGYGGWWYNRCHSANLNGAYASNKVKNNPTYCSAFTFKSKQYVPMKRTLMKFRCD